VIHLAASLAEPGRIRHNMGGRLIIGEPGGTNTARTQRLGEALREAGFEAVASTFIERDFWVKLLGNVSFNPVSALTLATADRMIADAAVKAYMVAIMRECLAVGPRDRCRCGHRPGSAHRHGAQARDVQDLDAAGHGRRQEPRDRRSADRNARDRTQRRASLRPTPRACSA
jgi:2-dehydropantoate 2-reductase